MSNLVFACSVLAFIPGPLVYGIITDAACLIWEESCGRRGNCWVYDSTKFKNYLHGLTLALYFTGSIFDITVIFLSKRIKNLYNDSVVESPVHQKLSASVDNDLALESQLWQKSEEISYNWARLFLTLIPLSLVNSGDAEYPWIQSSLASKPGTGYQRVLFN